MNPNQKPLELGTDGASSRTLESSVMHIGAIRPSIVVLENVVNLQALGNLLIEVRAHLSPDIRIQARAPAQGGFGGTCCNGEGGCKHRQVCAFQMERHGRTIGAATCDQGDVGLCGRRC